jgi:probable rRNA maturation factor
MIRLSFNIDTASPLWKKAFPRMRAKIEQAAAVAFLRAKKPARLKNRAVEINILLTTDAAIKRLNRDFRGMDKATNVLSFPASPPPRGAAKDAPVLLGDVALAVQTVRREARAQGKSPESHTVHLVAHGVLHLLGYDHMRLKDAKIMEKLECDILASLGYPDPYHDIASGKAGR